MDVSYTESAYFIAAYGNVGHIGFITFEAEKMGIDPTQSAIDWAWAKAEGSFPERCANALTLTVGKRESGSCSDISLAYADHYFQARYLVSVAGPPGMVLGTGLVLGYEGIKWSAEVIKLVGKMSTGKCPPSPATWLSVYWGLQGLGDGMTDWDTYMGC